MKLRMYLKEYDRLEESLQKEKILEQEMDMVKKRMWMIWVLSAFLLVPAGVCGAAAGTFSEPVSDWSLLGGYGITHKGLGKTKVQVQVVDLYLQYDRILFGDVGSSWYRGHHSLLVELPFTLVVDPDVSPMVGVNILGAWTFDSSDSFRPYLFGGGGILYTDADIPGLGSDINGNWQFGAGIRYRLDSGNWLRFEYRFHHISNTGAKDPNDPLNSSKFMIGVTF
ncbi:MAG: acyloxyacyl hydrolase [Desulfobulbaceae bacterium]